MEGNKKILKSLVTVHEKAIIAKVVDPGKIRLILKNIVKCMSIAKKNA